MPLYSYPYTLDTRYRNTTYGKKLISILKNVRFSGKGRQSLHIIIYVMRIRKNLISYVRLDHMLYHIAGNFGGRKLSRIGRKGAFRGENFRGMQKLIG